jgi:DNA polymerase-3 subunit epsilon
MLIIGIDIETTGGTHEICEFAAVALDARSGKELFSVASLVDPGAVTWNPFAMRVHGITPAMVRGKPRINDVWSSFKTKLAPYAATTRHFAHNASFERSHLSNGLGRQFDISLECTMALSKSKFQSNSYKLANVCATLKIPFRESHRAEPDARAAALVAIRLLATR